MGIFTRIKDIAAADVHRLLDRVEDPVSMARHYIRQLEDQMDNARSALEIQIAAEQHYDVLIARNGQFIDKRVRQAELAVDRNQDEIAAMALQEKLHHSKLQETYLEQREVIRRQTQALRDEIGRLQELHKDLNDKLTFLLARTNAAAALKATAAVSSPGDIGRISRGFERMEQKILRFEAGTKAYGAIGSEASRLSNWSDQHEVQSELEKLKAARRSS